MFEIRRSSDLTMLSKITYVRWRRVVRTCNSDSMCHHHREAYSAIADVEICLMQRSTVGSRQSSVPLDSRSILCSITMEHRNLGPSPPPPPPPPRRRVHDYGDARIRPVHEAALAAEVRVRRLYGDDLDVRCDFKRPLRDIYDDPDDDDIFEDDEMLEYHWSLRVGVTELFHRTILPNRLAIRGSTLPLSDDGGKQSVRYGTTIPMPSCWASLLSRFKTIRDKLNAAASNASKQARESSATGSFDPRCAYIGYKHENTCQYTLEPSLWAPPQSSSPCWLSRARVAFRWTAMVEGHPAKDIVTITYNNINLGVPYPRRFH